MSPKKTSKHCHLNIGFDNKYLNIGFENIETLIPTKTSKNCHLNIEFDKKYLNIETKKNILLLELLSPYFLDYMSAVLLVCDREKLSLPSGSQQANRVIMGDKECDFYGGDDDDHDDDDDDDDDDADDADVDADDDADDKNTA